MTNTPTMRRNREQYVKGLQMRETDAVEQNPEQVTKALWTFDAESRDIEFQNAPVFKVYEADDFPCLEDDERGPADEWYNAQAQTVVLVLNSMLHANGDTTPIPFATTTATPDGELIERLRAAAQAVLDQSFHTYRARNGRECYVEADDGEACVIVHSDAMEELRSAVLAADALARSSAREGLSRLMSIARLIVEDVSSIQDPTRLSPNTVARIVLDARHVIHGDSRNTAMIASSQDQTS